jgi:hypothetical protein
MPEVLCVRCTGVGDGACTGEGGGERADKGDGEGAGEGGEEGGNEGGPAGLCGTTGGTTIEGTSLVSSSRGRLQ